MYKHYEQKKIKESCHFFELDYKYIQAEKRFIQ